jgi:hypothetical protein
MSLHQSRSLEIPVDRMKYLSHTLCTWETSKAEILNLGPFHALTIERLGIVFQF